MGSVTTSPGRRGRRPARRTRPPANRRPARGQRPGAGADLFVRRRTRIIVRRTILAMLVAAAILVATVLDRQQHADELRAIRAGGLAIVAPLQNGATRAATPFRDAWQWTTSLVGATSARSRLEAEVEQLQGEVAQLAVVTAENDRLRELLELEPAHPLPAGVSRVTASIIARSPRMVGSGVVIDRGSRDGVSIGDAVITASGLAGRVSVVGPGTSRVVPIISSGEAVSVRTVGTEAQGVVRPLVVDGSPVLDMAYVPTSVKVEVGDLVVSSGWRSERLQSIYPAGLVVGTVTSTGSSPADVFKTIQVTPAVDFHRLSELVVLVGSATATSHEPLPSARDARGQGGGRR